MNPAHLHLIINHAPLFSNLFGTLCLIYSMKIDSRDLRNFAVALFVLGALTTIASHLTGDGAEHVVKHISGLAQDLVKTNIHEHEQASDFALWSSIILALTSLAMLWIQKKKPEFSKKAKIVVLVLALHSCTVMIRTAYLGGLIRHTEINATQN